MTIPLSFVVYGVLLYPSNWSGARLTDLHVVVLILSIDRGAFLQWSVQCVVGNVECGGAIVEC